MLDNGWARILFGSDQLSFFFAHRALSLLGDDSFNRPNLFHDANAWHEFCNAFESSEEVKKMFSWAVLFLALAVVAAVFAFSGIAGAATSIAQILFFVFLILLIVSGIAGAIRGKPTP